MSPIKINKIEKLTGHRSAIYALEQGARNQDFFSADGAGMVVQWDLTNPNQATVIAKVPHNVFALKYNKEQNYLYVGTHQGMFYVIDCQQKKLLFNGIKFPKALFAFESYRDYLLALGGDGGIYFINHNTFKVEKCFEISTKNLRSITYNEEDKEWIIGSSDHTIYIMDDNFQLKQKLAQHKNSIFTTHLIGKGVSKILLVGSRDAHLSAWTKTNGAWTLQDYLPAHNFTINKIVQNNSIPETKLFATASRDKTIKIWSANPVKLLKVIDRSKTESHTHSINTLLWSPFKNYLISGGDDKNIYVWKIEKN